MSKKKDYSGQPEITLRELQERGFDVESLDPANGEILLLVYSGFDDKNKLLLNGADLYLKNALLSLCEVNQELHDLVIVTGVELTSDPGSQILEPEFDDE